MSAKLSGSDARPNRRPILDRESDWGEWETKPGAWTNYRNRFFHVVEREAGNGVRHLMIEALEGPVRPTWYEAQRIKDELAGPNAVAVEVYPPRDELVDDSDHYHLWAARSLRAPIKEFLADRLDSDLKRTAADDQIQ